MQHDNEHGPESPLPYPGEARPHKPMSTAVKTFLAIVLLAIIAFIVYVWFHGPQTTVPVNDDYALSAREDSIYDAGKADAGAQLSTLRAQLAECEKLNAGKSVVVSAPRKVVATPRKVKAKGNSTRGMVNIKPYLDKPDFSPPPSSTPVTGGNTYTTNLPSASVIGLSDGDFWTSITPEGNLFYAFKKRLYDDAGGSGKPEMGSKGSGKFFVLDGENYVYVDPLKVTDAMLNNRYNWSVFIGDDKGYPAYLPHEVIKPAILQSRGKLDGSIVKEDVQKIGQLLPEVAAGRIRPNKVTKTNEGYAYNDGAYYEGWSFFTSILYQKK